VEARRVLIRLRHREQFGLTERTREDVTLVGCALCVNPLATLIAEYPARLAIVEWRCAGRCGAVEPAPPLSGFVVRASTGRAPV
jgi:hypothetical protein